jgi:hypothetical protein
MFFGRSRELSTILHWLRAGVGNIWLLGQKRVGKTSLLLHLKKVFLPEQGFVLAFVDFQLLGNMATASIFYEVANAICQELQADPRVGDLHPPERALFEQQPAAQLILYLRSLESHLGASRLVILLDEFSRTSDAYLQGNLARDFFDGWRGMLQAVTPGISFITVVQQQTYNSLSQRAQQGAGDPSWHLMELGEKVLLKSLEPEEVHRLIEWPMRNFVEFTAGTVASIAQLTGGNPFLIQAFCFKLAAHMTSQDRRQVEPADVEAVRQEFLLPTESVFAHFLDMIKGIGNQISQQLAQLAQAKLAQGHAPQVSIEELSLLFPHLPPEKVRRTLNELTASDLLVHRSPEQWEFASQLFQQWLVANAE